MVEPHIKEAAALLKQAQQDIAAGAGKLQAVLENPEVHKLIPYLLAGGAGAVGGAALSGTRRKRSGETRGEYLARILRNAVIAGGLVGGGAYLAGEGFKKTLGSVDLERPVSGNGEDPASSLARHLAFHPLIAAGTGTAAIGSAALSGNDKAVNASKSELMKTLSARFGGSLPTDLKDAEDLKVISKLDPKRFQRLLSGEAVQKLNDRSVFINFGDRAAEKELRRLAALSGINPHDASHTVNVMGKSFAPRRVAYELAEPLRAFFGRTAKQRIGRGAMGLMAAAVPAILGATLTNKPQEP